MASGIDNLLDALKQSGMNVDDIGGEHAEDAAERESGGASSGGFRAERGSRSRGDMPFGGFPFPGFGGGRGDGGGGGDEPPTVEFASSLGDRMAAWSKRTLTVAIIVAIIIILAMWLTKKLDTTAQED